jgi:hypothetical protein
MSKRYNIEVRDANGAPVKTIKRKLRAEMIGNFNPFFCTYNRNEYLVKSDDGDLSDPFRRDESYKLFIAPSTICKRS